MTEQERIWEGMVIRLLHPTQLLILEVLTYLDDPVSATALERMSDKQISHASFGYHCRRLEKLGLLKETHTIQRRGAVEVFFALHLNGRE